MAVQQGYGKMAGANSLVFAYDTTDTKNSFKGEPTENMITGNMNTSGAASLGSDDQGDYIQLGNNTSGYAAIVVPNIYIPSGVTYTWSFELKASETFTSNFSWDTNEYSDQYPNSNDNSRVTWNHSTPTMVANEWVQYRLTVTMKDGLTNARSGDFFRFLFPTFQNKKIYYRNVQFELKDHITPYAGLGGVRSNEQALLDLTGNHTVDVSTVDFTNGFELDGTNDHMTFNLTKTPNMTFEAIVNYPTSTAVPDSQMLFNAGNSGAGPDLYFSCGKLNWNIWDGCNNPFATIPKSWSNGKNHHIVIVNDQTNNITKCYYDGALLGTATYRQCTAQNMSIGGNGTSYNYRGNIPVFKVYNEALTEAQVQANFKVYRKRFEGLDYHIDDTTDGGGWIRFWWYTGVGWPGHETEALGHPFGTFDSSSHYGFQRLPEGLDKEQVELLAKDGDGNIYKWDFASPSATAQQVWDSFTQGTQGRWNNGGDAWDPEVIAGSFFNTAQDSWQYRDSEGVVSFLLDDDTCDCKSTLNAGHAMCGSGWNQTYAQPDGAYLRYGVDILNDNGCRGPVPENTLELFYRLK